jgi:hypothetical protein
MFRVIAAFFTLLLSSPQSLLNPQTIGNLWAQAEAQVAAGSVAYPAAVPWTPAPGEMVPLYSARFTARNNPFHMTVAQLVAAGAQLQPQTVVNNLFAQGIGANASGDRLYAGVPIYTAKSSDPVYTISCTYYRASGCDAQGKQIHIPNGVIVQPQFDGHLAVSDTAKQAEFDGWECKPPSGGQLSCYWGGWYPFGGKGLSNNGSDAIHGGYAIGLSTVVAADILQGHIDHALTIVTSCLMNPNIYPADQNNGGSDTTCGNSIPGHANNDPNPAPQYGSLVHLKLKPTQIASRGYSHGCTVVLNALSEYGAYMGDTNGNWGFAIAVENDAVYSAGRNPWQALSAINEFDSSGATWTQCLSGLAPSDIEIYSIPNLGY